MSRRPTIWFVLALSAALSIAAVLAACGEDQAPDGSAPDYSKALQSAPPALAKLYSQGDELLSGGPEAFDSRIAGLGGHPVVVNKWASWCGPCRAEFPFFQREAAERGDEVAFLGLNANDSEDAAKTFLGEYPVPYPSFYDPDQEIADGFDPGRHFPATAFYDAKGRLAYVRLGGYASRDDLAADIDRYARGG